MIALKFIIGTIAFGLLAYIWGLVHAKRDKKNKELPAGRRTDPAKTGHRFLKLVFALLACLGLSIWITYNHIAYPIALLYWPIGAFYFLDEFWIVFDFTFNIKTGRGAKYVSIKNGKLEDSIFKGSFAWQFTTKIILLLLFGITYLLLIN
jgi:hypothetical protein